MSEKRGLMHSSEGKDLLFGAVIMVLMAAIFIYACFIPMTSASGNVDSGLFPRLGSALGFCMGTVLVVQNAVKLRKAKKEQGELTASVSMDKTALLKVVVSIVWLAFYLWLMNVLGMVLASILYLLVEITMLTKKEKRTKKRMIAIVLVSVLMPLVVYFPFRYIFGIMLPMGIFR